MTPPRAVNPDDDPADERGAFDEEVSDAAVEGRAEALLPEERAAGSDDATAQAEAILEESESRTLDPVLEERRTSEETVDPN